MTITTSMVDGSMQVRVDRDRLADAVSWVARGLAARPASPILGGLLLEAGASGLRLSTFDYDVCAQATAEAQVGGPGRVLVPGRLFVDIVRGLPPEPVDLALVGAHLTVECAGFRYSMLTMPAEDYPERPVMPSRVGSIGTDAFAMAVAQVTVAAGRDLTLPLLTAVRLADLGDHLSLGCTDRYRMAVRPVPWRRGVTAGVGDRSGDVAGGSGDVGAGLGDIGRGPGAVGDGSGDFGVVLVPARVLADAAKALGGSRARAAAEVHLGLGDGTLSIECGDRRLICRLIESVAPDYDARVPLAGAWHAEVETALLIETVKRVSLVAAPLSPVRLLFGPGEVRLEAATGEEAKATATIGAQLHGDPIELAVKPQFLLDGLLALDSDVVTLTFTDSRQPVLLTGKAESGGGLRYLTMPLRL
jgi:DNA polymerase-3 subunit beta